MSVFAVVKNTIAFARVLRMIFAKPYLIDTLKIKFKYNAMILNVVFIKMRSLCGDLFFRIFQTLYNYFVDSRAVHIGNFELESAPLGNFPRAGNVF